MCYWEGKAVGELCSCCQNCSSYLTDCMPVVACGGYVVGECDFNFCEYCPAYEECEELFRREMSV